MAETQTAVSQTPPAPPPPPAAASQDLVGFLRQYDAPKLAAPQGKDALPSQYRIDMSKPLPQWSASRAPAYAATDESQPNRQLHAMLCPTGFPLRSKAISVVKDIKHPNLMLLVASGLVEIPQLGETRYVVIYETPTGQPLSSILRDKRATYTERTLASEIIAPLADLLKRFGDAGIAHGRLNLDNIFYGDRLIVGDCLSEPCGLSQPAMFEPIERALALPLGKGEADISADCYAAGMVTLHLAANAQSLTKLEGEQYIDNVLKLGAYNVLMHDREYSGTLQDFLRGTLNERINERWSPKTILSWLGGKRFNLIPPSPPRDASRSFAFLGEDYASRKGLAHALYTHWDQAPEVFSDNKLTRWLELSLHKHDLAETLNRIVDFSSGENTSRTPRQMNEILARAIVLLDPDGPIRMKPVQVRIEGIGTLLADFFLQKKQKELQILADIIENDVPNFWADQNKGDVPAEISTMLWRIQRVRLWMRQSVLGAGMERCLYDLNPTLACQSPAIARFNPIDLQGVLLGLDSVAKDRTDSEVLDRHSAAFICSKIDMQKDLKIHELQSLPSLVTHPKLIALKLLITAQEKTGLFKLRGLSAWTAHRLMPLLDSIHNRKARQQAQTQLAKTANSGDLRVIGEMMFSDSLFRSDSSRFEDAARNYHAFHDKIEELKSEENLAVQSQRNGHLIAQLFAICACIAVIVLSFNHYM